MSKIVYLFGAGASEGALPLVKEMPDRIESLIKIISSDGLALSDKVAFESKGTILRDNKREYQKELISDLIDLKDIASKHISVDTYAKKLFIRNDVKRLKKLKILLSVFFTIEQIIRPTNQRYDFFYASIIKSVSNFPDDIRILSWNYDFQFEIAFSEFSNDKNISVNQRILNVHTKNRSIAKSNIGTFGIYKLNGSAELHEGNVDNPMTHFYFNDISSTLNLEIMEMIIRMYASATYILGLTPNFSFAWEDSNTPDFDDSVMEETKDTKVLVIIGYSFPYFNRSVDRKIISNMLDLETVYFQSPEAKELMDRFKSIRSDIHPDQLKPIADLRYFYIPDELE
jgi:hypothetical protein